MCVCFPCCLEFLNIRQLCWVCCAQSLLLKRDINNSEELKQFLSYDADPSIAFARRRRPKSVPRIDKVCMVLLLSVFFLVHVTVKQLVFDTIFLTLILSDYLECTGNSRLTLKDAVKNLTKQKLPLHTKNNRILQQNSLCSRFMLTW